MLGRLLEQRLIRDPGWNRWAAGGDLLRGTRVNEDSAMQLLAVYSSVRVISEAISTLPVDVIRGSGAERTAVATPPVWVRTPNPDLNGIEFLSQIIVSMLLRGNAYALIERDAAGAPVFLWPLHPDWVQVRRKNTGDAISSRQYVVNGVEVSPFSMLHIPALMMPGALIGVDPITAARDALSLGIEAQQYGSKFFQQSAIPSGVITMPGAPLTLTQAKELAQQWRSMHAGTKRAHLPAVLSGGATYQPITITNEQTQFLETRRYTDQQVKELFGLGNPLQSGTEKSSLTYANVEQTSMDVARYALMPLTIRVEKAMTALLPRPQSWKFNFDAFLRSDTKSRYDAYRVANPTAVILSDDEIRALEDMAPLSANESSVPQPGAQANASS